MKGFSARKKGQNPKDTALFQSERNTFLPVLFYLKEDLFQAFINAFQVGLHTIEI